MKEKLIFKITTLLTAKMNVDAKDPKKFTFEAVQPKNPKDVNPNAVWAQDEYTGTLRELSLDSEESARFKYGYKLLAGEPCARHPEQTIVLLEVKSSNDKGATWKPALTFRYNFKPGAKDDDYPQPDPESDPTTYPEPDSDLPNYDDVCDPPDDDNSEDPSSGEGSDCDGVIGVAA